MIVGTVTEKQGPALKRVFDQMAEPKWVIAFGVCASTGGFYQNYHAMPGADQVIPVDVYIPGCPPRPEQVLDALILLMELIQSGRGHSQLRTKREAVIAAAADQRRVTQNRQFVVLNVDRHPVMSQKVLDALKAKFGETITKTESQHGDEIAWIRRDDLVAVATWLRDDPAMAFDAPVFCTCIDRLDWRPLHRPPSEAWTEPTGGPDDKPRFEVCYQLRSLAHRHRIRLKVGVPETDPRCPSLSELWSAFNWQERETFDMYGIRFDGHPDLRRIYLYDEFVGYPLRKDYPKEKRQPLVRRDDLLINPIKKPGAHHGS